MNLSEIVHSGMVRVASTIVSNPTFDHILGSKLSTPYYQSLACDSRGNLADRSQIEEHFDAHCRNLRHTFYTLSTEERSATHLAYASTINNRRALFTLEAALAREEIAARVINIADSSWARSTEISPHVTESTILAFRNLLEEQSHFTKGLLYQLARYAEFIQAADASLSQSSAHTFTVANDHSPRPVAYERIARHQGMKTAYLQHAEITKNFPALDFDLSVLRNEKSKTIYEAAGKSGGDVIVLPRAPGGLSPETVVSARTTLAQTDSRSVVIYPSSVSSIGAIAELASRLARNPAVAKTSVKLHPADRDGARFKAIGIETLREIPNTPHVAICGNSSVTIELVTAGNLVYQCFDLDDIPPDYYGFVENGLAYNIPIQDAERDFVLLEHASLDAHELARMDARVYSTSNTKHAAEARKALKSFFGRISI